MSWFSDLLNALQGESVGTPAPCRSGHDFTSNPKAYGEERTFCRRCCRRVDNEESDQVIARKLGIKLGDGA